MGNETDNVNRANTEKGTYDKTVSTMKIGVCEMQGWRKTMEDAAIVLPNFDKKTSLFGVLDGHGGSIVSAANVPQVRSSAASMNELTWISR